MRTFSRLAAMLSALLLIMPLPLSAQQAVPWPVKGKLIGKKEKKSKDVSGIACATAIGFPRQCLVIDDEAQFAQAVTLHDGRLEAGPLIPLIGNTHDGKPLELDGEGVAYANGTFYVMGSHGGPRRPKEDAGLTQARLAAASQIVPIEMVRNGALAARAPITSLSNAIAAQPELVKAAGQRLDENGVTIEGVAVRGDRLFAGFRGPTLSGHAAVLSVSIPGLLGKDALEPHLFKLPLGDGQGVRDLAAYGDRILVLAGPTTDGPARSSIVLWDGRSDTGVRTLLDLRDAGIGQDRKAEALLFLDETAKTMRVLVMFDGEKEGAPLAITLPKP